MADRAVLAPELKERSGNDRGARPISRSARPGGKVAQRAAKPERQDSATDRHFRARVPLLTLRAVDSAPANGLPAQLKAGVEALSGLAMDDVRVHRNSPEPAKLGALAYTRGSDIHLGPGQEQHLPHEAWHVVQQKEGRVKATRQLKGTALNEDAGLEREADAMAGRLATPAGDRASDRPRAGPISDVVQRSPAQPAPQARVQRRDIVGRGKPEKKWQAQFAPRPASVVPNLHTINAWQRWARELGDFRRAETERLKIPDLLKAMIQSLPLEVWLPSRHKVIGSSQTENSKLGIVEHLIVTEADPGPALSTDALRNKLYSRYLSYARPEELTKELTDLSATGIVSDPDFDPPSPGGSGYFQPFVLSKDDFTRQERAILSFLFEDDMLEWGRRDVELRESVEKEREWRDNVAFGGIAGFYSRVADRIAMTTFLTAGGIVATPGVTAFVAPRLVGVTIGELATAGTMAQLEVATVTGAIVGSGTSAMDEAISSAPALARGEISWGDWAGRIGGAAKSGAFWGGAFGGAGELAFLGLGKLLGRVRGGSSGATSGQSAAPAPAKPPVREPTFVEPPLAAASRGRNAPLPPIDAAFVSASKGAGSALSGARSTGNWLTRKMRNFLMAAQLEASRIAPVATGTGASADSARAVARLGLKTGSADQILVRSSQAARRVGNANAIAKETQDVARAAPVAAEVTQDVVRAAPVAAEVAPAVVRAAPVAAEVVPAAVAVKAELAATPRELYKLVLSQRGFAHSVGVFLQASVRARIAALETQLAVAPSRPARAELNRLRRELDVSEIGQGGLLGMGYNTFATILVIDRDGHEILAATGEYDGKRHAEVEAINKLRKGLAGKLTIGARIVVAGDREVCRACERALCDFAEELNAETVEGYIFKRSRADGRGLASEKTTARSFTQESIQGRVRELTGASPELYEQPSKIIWKKKKP